MTRRKKELLKRMRKENLLYVDSVYGLFLADQNLNKIKDSKETMFLGIKKKLVKVKEDSKYRIYKLKGM